MEKTRQEMGFVLLKIDAVRPKLVFTTVSTSCVQTTMFTICTLDICICILLCVAAKYTTFPLSVGK